MWFDKIKSYFDTGLWSVEMVSNAVVKGKISEEEYQKIVGEPYINTEPSSNLESKVNSLEEFAKIILGME